MKRYSLILLVVIVSGLTSLNAQTFTYKTLYSCCTINGVKDSLTENKTGRITIDLKKNIIDTRVRIGLFHYEKEYEVKYIIDSVKKVKADDNDQTVYLCHYADDEKAFVTVTDTYYSKEGRREIAFLNDNNQHMFVVK
jgi:hypothetical protein